MAKNPDCTNCKWADRAQVADENQKPVIGQFRYTCHRFPPSAFAVPGPGGDFRLASAFPVVTEGMVCSLHEFEYDSVPPKPELQNEFFKETDIN